MLQQDVVLPTEEELQAERDILVAEDWKPMRMNYDYSQSFTGSSVITQDPCRTYITETLLNPARNYINRVLNVKRVPATLLLPEPYGVGICNCDVNPDSGWEEEPNCMGSSNFTAPGFDGTDLIILVSVYNNQDDPAVAYGGACYNDPASYRPVAGMIKLNLAFILDSKG